MEARLIPESGGRAIRIERELSVVGRKRWVCDIRLDSDRVSKIHCLINRSQGRYYVIDLGSSNGTYVNGERISEDTEVCSGDELRFGNLQFTLQIDRETTSVEAAPRTIAAGETPLMAQMLDELGVQTSNTEPVSEDQVDEEDFEDEAIGLSSGSFSGIFEEVAT